MIKKTSLFLLFITLIVINVALMVHIMNSNKESNDLDVNLKSQQIEFQGILNQLQEEIKSIRELYGSEILGQTSLVKQNQEDFNSLSLKQAENKSKIESSINKTSQLKAILVHSFDEKLAKLSKSLSKNLATSKDSIYKDIGTDVASLKHNSSIYIKMTKDGFSKHDDQIEILRNQINGLVLRTKNITTQKIQGGSITFTED